MALLATAPFTSAFFFHFVVVFCGVRVPRGVIAGGYVLGGVSTLVSEFLLPAYLVHNRYIGWIALPYATGWIASDRMGDPRRRPASRCC